MAADVLKQLDERIAAMVSRSQQLKKENEQLAHKLAEAEKRYTEAAAQLKQFNSERAQHESERNEVRTKIEKILARFDGLDLG
ncbi:MAG TPA: cell division protein ZapB [Candidatus Binataceae bacterium]|nr:cell division protein ZapB [Candidatus Binataceae bacterium]